MKQFDAALTKALQSGDTDLIYLAIFAIRARTATQEFLSLLSKLEPALNIYIHYCKEHDPTKLKDVYTFLQQSEALGHCLVREAYQHQDLDSRKEKLRQALNYYRKTDSFATKVVMHFFASFHFTSIPLHSTPLLTPLLTLCFRFK
jgi:hypothetical protein